MEDEKRKVDQLAEDGDGWFKKMSLAKKSTITTWKALAIIGFIAGLLSAIIILQTLNLEQSSVAKENNLSQSQQDQELATVQSAIKEKKAKWVAKENPISKLSPAERKKRLGVVEKDKKVSENLPSKSESSLPSIIPNNMLGNVAAAALPTTLDWRNNGGNFVTPVKDQGGCGSCWAFSTTAGLESATLIGAKTPYEQNPIDFSEQIALSCSGAGSCSGGWPASVSSFFKSTGDGKESCYPYTASNGNCSSACSGWTQTAYRLTSYSSVSKSVDAIKNALYAYGPLITQFNVYNDFFYYGGGVYSYTSGSYAGGHAVLIVGYDDVNQAFIVKNSWGTGWGEAGFFKIAYSELSGQSSFGDSTAYYVAGGSNPPPIPATVALTAPNGGENWPAGDTNSIIWSFTGSPGNLKIDLLDASGTFISTIINNTSVGSSGSGSYDWTIPTSQALGQYKIRITSILDTSIKDDSNAAFNILAPLPASITITRPNGGESFRTRANQQITWAYTGNIGSTVKVELLKASGTSQTLGTVSTTKGSFSWKMSTAYAVGTDYTVRITSVSNPSISDTSNGTFSITK